MVATISPRRDFGSLAPFSIHRATSVILRPSGSLGAVLLLSVGQAELLDDRRGLAVVAVLVDNEIANAIATQV